jgi:hypothetical protein
MGYGNSTAGQDGSELGSRSRGSIVQLMSSEVMMVHFFNDISHREIKEYME